MMYALEGGDAYCYTGGREPDARCPTVVFIHGAQNDHSVWALQTRYFAHHGYNVLALDYRGYGGSQGRPTFAGVQLDIDAAMRDVRRRLATD